MNLKNGEYLGDLAEEFIEQDNLLEFYFTESQVLAYQLFLILQYNAELLEVAEDDIEQLFSIAQEAVRAVIKIASKYYFQQEKNSNIDLLELIQEGNIGLLKALKTYKKDKGASLVTHVYWHAKDYITKALSNKARIVRHPTDFEDEVRQYMKIFLEYEGIHGVTPLPRYMREKLGISKEKEFLLHREGHIQIVLFNEEHVGITNTQDVDNFSFFQNAEFVIEILEKYSALEMALSELSPDEQLRIALRFGLFGHKDHTLEQIAELFMVNAESTRRNIERTLQKMRRSLIRQGFRE